MWQDKLKKIVDDVCDDVKGAYENVKEEIKAGNIGEDIKKAGEGLVQAAEELKDKVMQGVNDTFKPEGTTNASDNTATSETERVEGTVVETEETKDK